MGIVNRLKREGKLDLAMKLAWIKELQAEIFELEERASSTRLEVQRLAEAVWGEAVRMAEKEARGEIPGSGGRIAVSLLSRYMAPSTVQEVLRRLDKLAALQEGAAT
ncbi:MAG: hypothetical protein C4291_14785 [Candidatus Dadabacteria bacterium]